MAFVKRKDNVSELVFGFRHIEAWILYKLQLCLQSVLLHAVNRGLNMLVLYKLLAACCIHRAKQANALQSSG